MHNEAFRSKWSYCLQLTFKWCSKCLCTYVWRERETWTRHNNFFNSPVIHDTSSQRVEVPIELSDLQDFQAESLSLFLRFYLFERQRRECTRKCTSRRRDRGRGRNRCPAEQGGTPPALGPHGALSQDPETTTQAEGGHLTDWTTQAPPKDWVLSDNL